MLSLRQILLAASGLLPLQAYFTYATVLRNFQVAQPPILPKGAEQCTVKLLQRDFAFSYGLAEVVPYTPPTDCGVPGSWAAITLNLTVTSNGTQYDRLAHFALGDVEIWRTSTPEPTRGDGIIWTYIKDVTRYTPLFAKNGTFIFQLDNVIQEGLDGVYSTVVHATYYASSEKNPPAKTSDLIVPLSTFAKDNGVQGSTNVTLPQNTVRVFAELYASGNAEEEFWYFNAANAIIPDLPPDTTYGQGPFREVRLLVDGQVAGAVYPYISIYTGGFVPAVWRPIPSYGALDLPTYFIDLTPFAPLLADGNTHVVTIDVSSAEEDHAVLQNWWVSGLLQVFTDPSGLPTTGQITKYGVEPYAKTALTSIVDDEGNVEVEVTASRDLHIEATIVGGSGAVNHVEWAQKLDYTNRQVYLNGAFNQTVQQTARGEVTSLHNGVPVVVDNFSYPITVNYYTILSEDGRQWKTDFDHSYNRDLLPLPIVLRSQIETRQLASGYYTRATPYNFGNGTNNNTFDYRDEAGNTYRRIVNAAYNNITLDVIEGSLADESPASKVGVATQSGPEDFDSGVFRIPGRT